MTCASLFSLVLRMEGVITGGFTGSLVISGVLLLIESTLAFTGGVFYLFFGGTGIWFFTRLEYLDFGIRCFLCYRRRRKGFFFYNRRGIILLFGANFFGVGRKEGSM